MGSTTEAEQAADEAIAQVERGATDEELRAVTRAVWDCIDTGQPFTAETVIERLGDYYAKIREPRLLGPVIRQQHRQGWIEPVGYVTGKRKASHGRPVRQWRAT